MVLHITILCVVLGDVGGVGGCCKSFWLALPKMLDEYGQDGRRRKRIDRTLHGCGAQATETIAHTLQHNTASIKARRQHERQRKTRKILCKK